VGEHSIKGFGYAVLVEGFCEQTGEVDLPVGDKSEELSLDGQLTLCHLVLESPKLSETTV